MSGSDSPDLIDAPAEIAGTLVPIPGAYLSDTQRASEHSFIRPFFRLSPRQFHQIVHKADLAECDLFWMGGLQVALYCDDQCWVLMPLQRPTT